MSVLKSDINQCLYSSEDRREDILNTSSSLNIEIICVGACVRARVQACVLCACLHVDVCVCM